MTVRPPTPSLGRVSVGQGVDLPFLSLRTCVLTLAPFETDQNWARPPVKPFDKDRDSISTLNPSCPQLTISIPADRIRGGHRSRKAQHPSLWRHRCPSPHSTRQPYFLPPQHVTDCGGLLGGKQCYVHYHRVSSLFLHPCTHWLSKVPTYRISARPRSTNLPSITPPEFLLSSPLDLYWVLSSLIVPLSRWINPWC